MNNIRWKEAEQDEETKQDEEKGIICKEGWK